MHRVLFISYSGVAGGAERVLVDCAQAVGPGAVVACPPGALAGWARAAGVPVLEVGGGPLALRGGARAGLSAAAGLLRHAVEVRRAAGALCPDVVVAWGMRSAIAWRLAGAGAFPAVVAHHDFLPGPALGVIVRGCARRARVVIVPSRAVADDLGPVGDVRVVAPGVDVESFDDLGEPVSPPEVLVLGALAEWKRPDLALEVLARARRSVPGLRLRIVGAPVVAGAAVEAALRRRAADLGVADAVSLVGAVADVRPELARAACLLHCAPREPFGLALVEAMASGRPVVAPDAGGPAEIVDRDCGRLYRAGDAAAGAAALVSLLASPGEAARAGAAARAVAARRFGRARAQAEFAAAVAEVSGGARAAPGAAALGAIAARPGRVDWTVQSMDHEPDRPVHRDRGSSEALTIVTVLHDSAAEVRVLLESVARCLPGARVVAVDSGSADGGVAVCEGFAGVETVALGSNVGFGRACNIGLARVHTPVTALLNPDVELIDDSLLALAGEALRGEARLLAPRVLNGDGSVQDTAHPVPASAGDLARALLPPAAVPGRLGRALAPWRSVAPRRVGWAVGCALVARTETLRALGPFDESIFLFGEDLELGLRAREHGVPTWLWPGAVVVHRGRHAAARAFGGEPFARLARARHDVVARRLGARRAAADDAAQMVTFGWRIAVRRALGLPAGRERRQLAAVRAVRGARR